MEPLISIKNLKKRFGKEQVFENLNLEVFKEEILVIMGASGSGKSTLLNIIAELDSDYEGEIWRAKELSEGVTIPYPMVFQESESLLPWMNVMENIRLVAPQIKDDRLMSLLKEVEMADDHHKYPKELSGGMKQRVGIARALACRSKILLMDEPFASLDGMLRAKLQDLIRTIKVRDALTVVFVTHDQAEAERLGDRIIQLNTKMK